MKKLFLTSIITLMVAWVAAQQPASVLKWKSSLIKEGSTISVVISGIIPAGWYVYADSISDLELNGVSIQFAGITAEAINGTMTGKRISRTDPIFDNRKLTVFTDSICFKYSIQCKQIPKQFDVLLRYNAATLNQLTPEDVTIPFVLDSAKTATFFQLKIASINLNNPVNNCTASSAIKTDEHNSGLVNLFFLGFLGGLVALFTPCVFPMVPLTVSFFTKKSNTRVKGIANAFTYAFFIFLIYFLLSLPFHFLDKLNPEILNNISTNVVLNLVFFIVFVVFAFSFFGFYELTLPSRFSNVADSKSSVATITGIFFMALTLAIVSFSCTGPILGSLLAGSLTTNGGAMQLTVGMSGFGLALALPFGLFALFPQWLSSIPKSGGWMTTVKVTLGFLEVALAFKFLSNADLVKHWGLLKREVFIFIWILCGLLLSLYLFGWINDKRNKKDKINLSRKILAAIVLIFTIYLLPGVTNTKYANLSLISGFPPPLYYSVYKKASDCMFNLDCTHSYEEGVRRAKEQKKPLLLDFTGYACVNCRRMEENVWNNPAVIELMQKYVVVSLYVDDKKKLPSTDQFQYQFSDGTVKKIITEGDKWSTFQTENFNNNSQPMYAILSSDEKLLNHPIGYTPSVNEYSDWLQCGIDANKMHSSIIQ